MTLTDIASPIRIQCRRAKGFDLQAQSPDGRPVVYVGRPTMWGNPFNGDRDACVAAYRQWLTGRCDVSVGPDHPITGMAFIPAFAAPGRIMRNLPSLRGKHLACWCSVDCACHADVLLELAQ